jgi:hypothetical protein
LIEGRAFRVNVSLPLLHVFGLVIAAILAGAGLMMLGIGGLARLGQDTAAAGCSGIGAVLLTTAGFVAVRVLSG